MELVPGPQRGRERHADRLLHSRDIGLSSRRAQQCGGRLSMSMQPLPYALPRRSCLSGRGLHIPLICHTSHRTSAFESSLENCHDHRSSGQCVSSTTLRAEAHGVGCGVAVFSCPGLRPPPGARRRRRVRWAVAILGHLGGRPPRGEDPTCDVPSPTMWFHRTRRSSNSRIRDLARPELAGRCRRPSRGTEAMRGGDLIGCAPTQLH